MLPERLNGAPAFFTFAHGNIMNSTPRSLHDVSGTDSGGTHTSRLCVFALTPQGIQLAARLCPHLQADLFLPHRLAGLADSTTAPRTERFLRLADAVRHAFSIYDGLIFIAACGIAVRSIAPLLQGKDRDPAVVVLDQQGLHAVSLLSGHLGGANALACRIAAMTGGTPVITTATDTEGLPSLDLLAAENNMAIARLTAVRHVNAALLEGRQVAVADRHDLLKLKNHPCGLFIHTDEHSLDNRYAALPSVLVTIHASAARRAPADRLVLHPRILHAGLGCRKNVPAPRAAEHLLRLLEAHDITPLALASLASVEAKRAEPAMHEASRRLGVPVIFFSSAALAAIAVPNPSSRPLKAVGTPSVAEAAALLAARTNNECRCTQHAAAHLIIPKAADGDVTAAVAQEQYTMHPAPLYIVGLGPGDPQLLTPQAADALRASEVIAGYTRYVELVPDDILAGREIIATGMMGEMERCAKAIETALSGRATAVVCSGDPGIYAMAGLIYELIEEMDAYLPVHVIAGVPALSAAAALLGAPLMHDFACISLSDLLTPWEVIEKRLQNALEADFVVVLYNPRSKKRDWQLEHALETARRYRQPETPVGLVRQANRPEQAVSVAPLSVFEPAQVDMLSIVIIGNSTTRIIRGNMVTPRGYMKKYR
ncbi:precorrin-3B C17-methyltransferase [Oleidesulfovibrio alaskensis G20]|jgi:cobalt-precorrin 5A hydrolase/precorrin-3B C17-methyltransferase|uniref:Precorrin-3B C17-methyltransferase n=2 Tax=Oleidesulfovibrio alaskensis TaxID=58180 RepID=Q30WH1_OLEA2|nr:precorrin-3B C17-methyltransferase [Oleidesulfovibrio alaskensis G20]